MNEMLVNKVVLVDKRLAKRYGKKVFREGKDPLTELIFTILSQNTSDGNRDKAYESLKRHYPTWADVAKTTPARLAGAIQTGGLSKIKADRILKMLKAIKKTHGQLNLDFLYDRSNEEVAQYLHNINGVGPKTIACVLAFSLGRDIMPVDTHVHRVSIRLGILPAGLSAEAAHEYFLKFRGKVSLYQFHLNLIEHGRKICRARNPRCESCFLNDKCDYYSQKMISRRPA
jgi:endonuclease-3